MKLKKITLRSLRHFPTKKIKTTGHWIKVESSGGNGLLALRISLIWFLHLAPSRLAKFWSLIMISALLFSKIGIAQIQDQPTSIVEAETYAPFSERSGQWPFTDESQNFLSESSPRLTDELNHLSGVQARSIGSPVISIRGSAQADRVLSMLDGIPLNLADGSGAAEVFIPSENLESVRLFKGPASVFFGPSAMAGALDYRLKWRTRPFIALGASDEGGQFGERSISFVTPFSPSHQQRSDIPSSEASPWRGQVSGYHSYRPGEDLYQAVSSDESGRRTFNSNETSRGITQGKWQRGSLRSETLILVGRRRNQTPGALYYPSKNTVQTDGFLAAVKNQFSLTESQQVAMRLGHLQIWGDFIDHDWNSNSNSSTARNFSSLDHTINGGTLFTLQSFIDWRADSYSASWLGDQKQNDQSTEFGQSLNLWLNPSTSLVPSYRYLPRQGIILPAVGVFRSKENSSESIEQWLTYSEGYRQPSLSDFYSRTNYFLGNPHLKPERSNSIEVGFTSKLMQITPQYQIDIVYGGALFLTRYQNLFATSSLNATQSTKINKDEAQSFGGELKAAVALDTWSLSGSYNYLNARILHPDEALPLSPKHQGQLSLMKKIWNSFVILRGTFWSSYFDREVPSNKLRELPEWQTYDLIVENNFSDNINISFGVLNILNRPRELTLGFPEPQRQFIANVSYQF